MHARYIIIAALLALITACGTTPTALAGADGWEEAKGFGPPNLLVAPDREEAFPTWEDSPGVKAPGEVQPGIFDLAYRFYIGHLTQMDGPRCEHRPTCSRYAYLAIQKHGAPLGSFMAVDRLMRSSQSSTLRRLPIYKIEDGKVYFLDPVDANDFFL